MIGTREKMITGGNKRVIVWIRMMDHSISTFHVTHCSREEKLFYSNIMSHQYINIIRNGPTLTVAAFVTGTLISKELLKLKFKMKIGDVLLFLLALIRIGKSETLEWWQKAVFYQLYPRSFYDSDGDGIGDLTGIKMKADYLEYLGVKAVWLNPIYTSPMKDFGYDIQNFTDIDPMFGTLDDFIVLMKELKEKGINIIMDFVPNHSSDKHVWFEKSRQREDPYTDYYVWVNGTGPNGKDVPNNWISVFGGSAWEWDSEREQYYLHQFLKEQPDLNYNNKHLREEMKKALRFWLDLGVDGFRIDALKFLFEVPQLHDEPLSHNPSARPGDYNYLIHNFTTNLPEVIDVLAEWREVLNEYQNKDGQYRVIVVEVTDLSLEELVPYFGNASHPLADMPFNFDFLQITNTTSAKKIQSIITNWLDNSPGRNWPNWVLGNHDQPRLVNKTGADLNDALNIMSLSLKGTPFTYYGEEIGMVDTEVSWNETQDPAGLNMGEERYKEFSRDPERSPMQWNSERFSGFTQGNKPWLPVNPNYKEVNVEVEKQNSRSHLKVYKSLVALREKEVFRNGKVEFPYVTDDILSFVRIKKGELFAYVILINFGINDNTINLNLAKSSTFRFPRVGVIELSSGNIPDDSPLAKYDSLVELHNIRLGKHQAVIIRFIPLLPFLHKLPVL